MIVAVKAFRKMAEEGIVEALRRAVDPRAMVERRNLIGGLAPVRVKEQLAKSRGLLDRDRGKVEAKRKRLAEAAWKLETAIDAIIGE